MIQPLKTPKTHWFLYWLDLEEPLPSGDEWFLPTLIIVCDQNGTPVAPPEVLEELDQTKIENLLYRLFDRIGQPERLSVSASDDWDSETWRSFSADCKVEIRFQNVDTRTPDELGALTKTLVLRAGRDAGTVDAPRMAEALTRTATRMRSGSKKISLLRLALARDPDCSAARVELADIEFQKGSWKACLELYEEVIRRDTPRWLGSATVPWWEESATRPLLRSIYGKAMTEWHLARYGTAARTLERLLSLNPKDNQGARFLIPMLHLLDESTERARQAFDRYAAAYPGDYSEPSFLFGWGLSYSLAGQEHEARAKYIEGCLKNIYMAPMLLEQDEPPRGIWLPNDRAEPNYAAEFIESYAVLWDREPGALRLLREVQQEIAPRIDALVAHRSKMADFQDQRYDPDYKSAWQELVNEDERLMKS